MRRSFKKSFVDWGRDSLCAQMIFDKFFFFFFLFIRKHIRLERGGKKAYLDVLFVETLKESNDVFNFFFVFNAKYDCNNVLCKKKKNSLEYISYIKKKKNTRVFQSSIIIPGDSSIIIFFFILN